MKTALDTFLEQIILNRVKGSVYLVPAITDIQIQEAKELFKQQIIEAVDYCWTINDKKGYVPNGEDYFNQTYNQ